MHKQQVRAGHAGAKGVGEPSVCRPLSHQLTARLTAAVSLLRLAPGFGQETLMNEQLRVALLVAPLPVQVVLLQVVLV